MGFWFKIFICQSCMMHECCCINFQTKIETWKHRQSAKENPKDWYNSGNRAAVDRIGHVSVEDLVLSQEDKPKRHRSARDISRETALLCSSVHRIIRCDPAQMLQTTSCSAVVWSQQHLRSRALINNLIVCNKSCYCSIINWKLNSK